MKLNTSVFAILLGSPVVLGSATFSSSDVGGDVSIENDPGVVHPQRLRHLQQTITTPDPILPPSPYVPSTCALGSDHWDAEKYPAWVGLKQCSSDSECPGTPEKYNCCMRDFCFCGHNNDPDKCSPPPPDPVPEELNLPTIPPVPGTCEFGSKHRDTEKYPAWIDLQKCTSDSDCPGTPTEYNCCMKDFCYCGFKRAPDECSPFAFEDPVAEELNVPTPPPVPTVPPVPGTCEFGSKHWNTVLYPAWIGLQQCTSDSECPGTPTKFNCCMKDFCYCGYSVNPEDCSPSTEPVAEELNVPPTPPVQTAPPVPTPAPISPVPGTCEFGSEQWDTVKYPAWIGLKQCKNNSECLGTPEKYNCCMKDFCYCGHHGNPDRCEAE